MQQFKEFIEDSMGSLLALLNEEFGRFSKRNDRGTLSLAVLGLLRASL